MRHAYRCAQGEVLDIKRFIELFTEDGVFNAGQQTSYHGEHLGDVMRGWARGYPMIELSIQGTFLGRFEPPSQRDPADGAKLDMPCGDFWYVRDGWIQEFNCYVSTNSMLAQMGVLPDFASSRRARARAVEPIDLRSRIPCGNPVVRRSRPMWAAVVDRVYPNRATLPGG